MTAIPGFYNFPYTIVVDSGEKEIYLTITTMFSVLNKKHFFKLNNAYISQFGFFLNGNKLPGNLQAIVSDIVLDIESNCLT